jgi:hypothetical protein
MRNERHQLGFFVVGLGWVGGLAAWLAAGFAFLPGAPGGETLIGSAFASICAAA